MNWVKCKITNAYYYRDRCRYCGKILHYDKIIFDKDSDGVYCSRCSEFLGSIKEYREI